MPDQLTTVVAASSAGHAVGGSSDCVILADMGSGRSRIEILQVIESLSYCPDGHVVKILLDIISRNSGDSAARYRVVHRGGVKAHLRRFPVAGQDGPRQVIIRQLYGGRIREEAAGAIGFQCRLNCVGVDDNHTNVSLDGPGGCLQGVADRIMLHPEIGGAVPDAAFTSYVIPPPDLGTAIGKGEVAICRLEMEIPPHSYKRLVEGQEYFSVDSYARLMRDIVAVDLPGAPPEYDSFYRDHLARADTVISPVAYDIIIFQTPETDGCPVQVESSSMCVDRVRPADPEVAARLENEVLWFFGQKQEFHLRLRFTDSRSRSVPSPGSAFAVPA